MTRGSAQRALGMVAGRPWSRAAAWLWLVQSATEAGRVAVSQRDMAARFCWTRAKTRRFIDSLSRHGLIRIEERPSGPFTASATICAGNDFPTVIETTGPTPSTETRSGRTIRAPSAPDKRLAFFAAMVNGAEPVPPGVISPIMAQALVAAGAVSIEALRRKGVMQ